MHKILSFHSQKGFHRCLDCLGKDDLLKQHARHLSAVRTLIVREEHFEHVKKLLGAEKYTVSPEVSVRLHMTDEIPWGVSRIGAPSYWKQTEGQGVKVAVIDTGISRNHYDLRGRVKKRVDFVGRGPRGRELNGHGTHVAGTIAAAANDRGIVGAAPGVELYDVRAFGPDGTANVSDIVAGINWSIEQRVDVINMSFGTTEDSYAMRHAIARARRAGIILVASAGNNGGQIEYPAAYKGVISVGALDQNNRLADFSSRRPKLDTTAPGVGIKSTWPNNQFRVLDGTSMAAAHVSGLYALRLAAKRKQR